MGEGLGAGIRFVRAHVTTAKARDAAEWLEYTIEK